MKLFSVAIVQRLRIAFEDDRATAKSAEYIALKCWGSRTITGDLVQSKTLGRVTTELVGVEIQSIEEAMYG